MSFSKVDRATYGPGWGEIIFGAVLAIALGILIAMSFLAFKPVATVTKLPDPKVLEGQVTFMEGSKDAYRGQTWIRKHQAFLDGKSIELTEDELNAAIAKSAAPPAKAEPKAEVREIIKPKKKAEAEKKKADQAAAADEPYLVPGPINFRVADGLVQVALPVRIPLLDTSVIIQVAGVFEKGSSGTFEFVARRFYIGSLPVHSIPHASEEIFARLSRSDAIPEDMRSAWAKIVDVRIEKRLLKIDMP